MPAPGRPKKKAVDFDALLAGMGPAEDIEEPAEDLTEEPSEQRAAGAQPEAAPEAGPCL